MALCIIRAIVDCVRDYEARYGALRATLRTSLSKVWESCTATLAEPRQAHYFPHTYALHISPYASDHNPTDSKYYDWKDLFKTLVAKNCRPHDLDTTLASRQSPSSSKPTPTRAPGTLRRSTSRRRCWRRHGGPTSTAGYKVGHPACTASCA